MNLVMVGRFKSIESAKKVEADIAFLTERLEGLVDVGNPGPTYGNEAMRVLWDRNINILSPFELEQLFYDVRIERNEDTLVLTTDESEVSAFFKLMFDGGAKVEIFSAHEYTEEPYGRGK